MSWIVCHIGAREHYAIPRVLDDRNALAALVTDFWVPPRSSLGYLPKARRLRDRYHPALATATVHAPNLRMLALELGQRARGRSGWESIIARNKVFQRVALTSLKKLDGTLGQLCIPTSTRRSAAASKFLPSRDGSDEATGLIRQCDSAVAGETILFSYSYAALELFRFAKSRGWRTVLGQIDPGPEEERIVAAECDRYSHLVSSWKPAPQHYWENWREEVRLADRIIVNSEWSQHCLAKEGVPSEKMEIVPLVYQQSMGEKSGDLVDDNAQSSELLNTRASPVASRRSRLTPFKVLFLGQVNLRKGVGRLLDAMRLLRDEQIELTLAGPSSLDSNASADLPNVRWVGPVPRSQVTAYYSDADLFILPTLSDGYALTQLEALAHGLPVLASKYCGAAVTQGENGWILDDLEPDTIAQALCRARDSLPLSVKAGKTSFGLSQLADALLESTGGSQGSS